MAGRLLNVGSVHWTEWDGYEDVACLVAWFSDPWTVGVVRCRPMHPLEDWDPHNFVREVPITRVHQQVLGEQAESLAHVAAVNLGEFFGDEEASRLLGKPVRSLAS